MRGLSLREGNEAVGRLKTGRARGKVVIDVTGE